MSEFLNTTHLWLPGTLVMLALVVASGFFSPLSVAEAGTISISSPSTLRSPSSARALIRINSRSWSSPSRAARA